MLFLKNKAYVEDIQKKKNYLFFYLFIFESYLCRLIYILFNVSSSVYSYPLVFIYIYIYPNECIL